MAKYSPGEERLREKGIRCTRQRTAILEVLMAEKRPLSAKDIFTRLKKNNPQLRLSTVYRNLNYFEKKDLVKKMELELDRKEKYFELLEGEHHHHLVCIGCGEIVSLRCPLENFEEELSRKTHYQITDHRIKIYGLCPECQ